MKELFSQAVQLMKRKDFLDDFIREKAEEEAKITAEVAILRKKNGRQVGSELDLQIFQLNRKKAEIQKLVSKCKAEIKTLKTQISDLLIESFAKTDKPELREKVKSAFNHAFEGKNRIISDEEVGGAMGDSQIVGAIITHDKKKRNQTALLKRGGIINSQGKIVVFPQVVVYEYDKKREEGEFHKEDDSYKTRVKQPKPHPTIDYFKSVYGVKQIVIALLIVAVYSAFAVWTAVKGIDRFFDSLIFTYTAILGVSLFTHAVVTSKNGEKGGMVDVLPLSAILISIVSAITQAGAYNDIVKELIFPVTLLIYGVFTIILRKKLSKFNEKSKNHSANLILSIVVGVILAVFTDKLFTMGNYIDLNLNECVGNTAKAVFIFVLILGLISSIYCLIKKEKSSAQGFLYLVAVACSYLTILLLISKVLENLVKYKLTIGAICLVFLVCGIVGTIKKGEKDGL